MHIEAIFINSTHRHTPVAFVNIDAAICIVTVVAGRALTSVRAEGIRTGRWRSAKGRSAGGAFVDVLANARFPLETGFARTQEAPLRVVAQLPCRASSDIGALVNVNAGRHAVSLVTELARAVKAAGCVHARAVVDRCKATSLEIGALVDVCVAETAQVANNANVFLTQKISFGVECLKDGRRFQPGNEYHIKMQFRCFWPNRVGGRFSIP